VLINTPQVMRRVTVVTTVAVPAVTTHDATTPLPHTSDSLVLKRTIASTPENVNDRISKAIKKSPVVLFMKGYPEQPMCGFSRNVVLILKREGVKFDSYNVLDDEGLREGIKAFSNWPTIPQLYINGEFVGGSDIASTLHTSGELKKMLEAAGAICVQENKSA